MGLAQTAGIDEERGVGGVGLVVAGKVFASLAIRNVARSSTLPARLWRISDRRRRLVITILAAPAAYSIVEGLRRAVIAPLRVPAEPLLFLQWYWRIEICSSLLKSRPIRGL